jgi:hypothetical protein
LGQQQPKKETDMAILPTKAARKKPSRKVRDLAVRKDPKGGAQKKEGPDAARSTRGGGTLKLGKNKLS